MSAGCGQNQITPFAVVSRSEPEFVGSFSIPDTQSPDDDKVYFFFRETAVEAGQWDRRVFSRVARVCKVLGPEHGRRPPLSIQKHDPSAWIFLIRVVPTLLATEAKLTEDKSAGGVQGPDTV